MWLAVFISRSYWHSCSQFGVLYLLGFCYDIIGGWGCVESLVLLWPRSFDAMGRWCDISYASKHVHFVVEPF